MFQDKFVFAQLVAFLDRSKFNRIVAKYNGDRYVKHLTCWNQFLAMMFGQCDLGSLFSKSQYFASTEILRLLYEILRFLIIRNINGCSPFDSVLL